MDELPKRVLYSFYPDRILQFDQIVIKSGTSLPFVRNTVNKLLIAEGYLEEIHAPKPGQKHDYFRLTDKGRIAVNQIHIKREWMKKRIDELVVSGVAIDKAAVQVAVESVALSDMV